MPSTEPTLTRSFFDLPTDNKAELEEFDFLRGLSGGRELTWEQLLQAQRVLIVSEAGMGKTFECKAQKDKLFRDGESAFYLELATLADKPPENQFSPEERKRFESWKNAQTERAYFFLDSIDELKLTASSFELTLKQFATALGDHLDRACVVLTTRPGGDDRDVVRRQLPMTEVPEAVVPEEFFADVAMRVEQPKKAARENDSRWRFVALAPLDEAQMRMLATAKEVSDPDKLMAAIETEHAGEYAKRPLDFIELCGDWKAHSRIRGHRDQVETSVAIKLRPRTDRKEPAELSPKKARDGAERLALAAMMTRKLTLWHGTDADRGRGDDALEPRTVLAEWTELEVRTLLERALFGFATYGRVRFHNRSVIEYLAAERLCGLIKHGLSMRSLNRLLFVKTPVGREFVRPTMEPVAAWLAASLNPVGEEILKRDPSVLLRHGDPAALDPSTRAHALTRYVEVYGAGGWRGLRIPALQCRRLASQDLAATIQKLWSTGIENPEVRETLLDLIEAGRFADCADIAFRAAVDVSRDARERLTALQAMAAIDDARFPGLLDLLAAQHADWLGDLASAAVVLFFPEKMSVTQLLGSLRGITYNPREIGGIARALPDAINRAHLMPARLDEMRQGLTDLVNTDCRWETAAWRIRAGRRDLVGALTRTCELQLLDRAPEGPLSESIALALQLSPEDDYTDDDSKQLRTLLATSPMSLRSKVFWAQYRLLTLKVTGKDASARWFRMVAPPAMMLIANQDLAWMRTCLGDQAISIDERSTLLECIIHLAQETIDRVKTLKAMSSLVSDEGDLAARLQATIDAWENPAAASKAAKEQAERAEARRRKALKDRASWIQFWRELSADADERFNPDRTANTAWNLAEWMSRAPKDDQYAGWNRGFLERVFDTAKVERLRAIMMGTWRSVKPAPSLPSERPKNERNLYYSSWRVGLSGLYAEAEDPQWARRLTVEDAQLAMRFAMTSLNGLPDWVGAVTQAHPEIVRDLLRPELEAQLNDTGADGQHSSLLQYIAHADPEVISLFVAPLRDWINRTLTVGVGPLMRANKFERAIELLLEHGTPSDASVIQAAAHGYVRAHASQEQTLFWLPLLMRLAPREAIFEMERLASGIEPAAQSDVTQWFGALFGHHAHRTAATPTLLENATLLSRLTLLAYRHIRTTDDRSRGGRHESNARDDAEFARSQLVSALLSTKGDEAWRIKLEFAENPLVVHFRDRARAVANREMAQEWDAPSYALADVERLESELDVAPLTRADMAAVLLDRLAELTDRLREDSSPREMWSKIEKEKVLRRAVAAELERLAHGVYTVDQEAVTSEEKETDIRLRSCAKPIEAVIELKLGDNKYSYADFSKALRDQLVGRYMAPESRRAGCLMISIASKKQWKHPSDGHMIEIEEVIQLLQNEAMQIVIRLGFGSQLEVHLLDLRPVTLP